VGEGGAKRRVRGTGNRIEDPNNDEKGQNMLKGAILVAAGSILLILLHRLLLRMEEKGYIYYMKSKGIVDRAGIAMVEMQSLLEPGKRHVIQEQRKETRQDEDTGAPPEPPA
jgi:hypothetical protein